MKMTREEAIETLGHVVPFATQNGGKAAIKPYGRRTTERFQKAMLSFTLMGI